MATIREHVYDTRGQLAEALAAGVAAVLAGGIATRGRAALAVSGGSTPALFFAYLSQAEIDWPSVTILLVDERYVPDDTDRSNAKLVRENLMIGPASEATFVPVWRPGVTPETAAEEVARAIDGFEEGVDALILGMGTDGHTASFFPQGDTYARATNPNEDELVLPLETPEQPETRVTVTMPVIQHAHFLALHIEGNEKREVFEAARQGNELPISLVLGVVDELQLFWTAQN